MSSGPPVALELPKASDATNPIARIRVHPSGEVLLDAAAAPADDAAILAWARTRITENPELRVSISAESATPHGAVMNVVDLLKQAGVNRVAFAPAPRPPAKP